MKDLPVGRDDPDALFTVTVALMWQLYYTAVEHGLEEIAGDLVVAIGELDGGPWLPIHPAPFVAPVPLTLGCVLLDRLLAELARVTPGFGARVAITKTRIWLDPDHQQRPQ